MEPKVFHVFKGLQKPLEFMGIRGRFLIIAAATIGIGFLSFLIVGMIVESKLVSFAIMLGVIGTGYGVIRVKQKTGLHSKKKDKGILIYKHLFRNNFN